MIMVHFITIYSVPLELVPHRVEKKFQPRPQTRILVPLGFFFSKCLTGISVLFQGTSSA